MKVVGICRFSLVGRGDWKIFRGNKFTEAQALADQVSILFTEERLEARLKSFEIFTLASIKAQTEQNFLFIVLASKLMPSAYQTRLENLCADIPQVCLRFFDPITAGEAQRKVFDELNIKYSEVLQFRLDDDDCVCSDFVERMQKSAVAANDNHEVFVVSMRGVMYCAIGGECPGIYYWPVDFMSAGAAIRHSSKSIYNFGHFGMAERFHSIVISGGMSLVTHNGNNDTSLDRDTVKRRGMVLLSADESKEIINKHFPFISDQAKTFIGANEKQKDDEHKFQAPSWLLDFSATSNSEGFFISNDSFALQHTYRGNSTLYVGFDNLSSVRASSKLRDPWGYEFAKKEGWSSLGVLNYKPNWFRDKNLISEMEKLSNSGFFKKFNNVIFCGTSMGGYGACAFSSLAPGCTVIAFSPQSTLDKNVVDWDKRYPEGTDADWVGPYADGAEEVKSAKKVFIVYDKDVEEDRRHAERMSGENSTLLNARYSGHFTAQFLTQIGILSAFVREVERGKMNGIIFYGMYRKAREYRRFAAAVVHKANIKNKSHLKRYLKSHLLKMGLKGMAKNLEAPSKENAA